MSRGPSISVFREAAAAWIVLLAAWGIVAVGGLLWLAGGIATWLTGNGLSGPPFDFQFAEDLIFKGPSGVWPHASPGIIAVIFAIELAAIGIPIAMIVVNILRRQNDGEPLDSLAMERDLADLTPDGVRRRAMALRPKLAAGGSALGRWTLPLAEAGVPLGRLRPGGTELRASWEDVAVAIMAPRSGKTTACAVPAILDAPGPVVVTSNKSDVWATTSAIRARETGEDVWVFDPQGITHLEQTWWWNPLRDVTNYDAALRLAMHFMKEVNEDSQQKGDEFWVSAATDLLTALFLAAGATGRTLLDVYEWLNDPGNPRPYEVLHDEIGDLASAASLNARQTSAPETREGIYEFARTACRCLRNPDILRWVVPPGRHQSLLGDRSHLAREFTVEGFALSHQTIYLLSKDGAAAAAPLVASLTDRILVEATREAERQQRGRLDPPMVVILDEAANICKIADLPLLYSHLGGRGIYVLTILQSRPQARSVWGHDGFDTMWSAATIKLIGAGIDDPDLAADISSLVGEHDISIRSISSGTGGTFSESVALRKDPIMSPSAIRAMAKGTAILLATGAVPASIELQPWYRSDRADEIELEVRQATAALTGLAVQAMEKEEAMAAPRVARLRRRRRRADVAVVPAAHRPPPPAAAAFGEVPWGTDATHSATTTAERPVTTDEPPATSISVRAYSQDGEDQGVRDVDFDDTQVVPLTERTSKQRKKMRP